jgi:hypothetical protein
MLVRRIETNALQKLFLKCSGLDTCTWRTPALAGGARECRCMPFGEHEGLLDQRNLIG